MIELLVVVVIAFTLLALFGVLWRNLDTRNRISRAQTQLAHIQNALQDYRNEMGSYPDSLTKLSNRLPRAFTEFNAGIPRDPWGSNYYYNYAPNDQVYILFSFGPDANETNTADNICPGRF
jgi:general secretion pathway protein G